MSVNSPNPVRGREVVSVFYMDKWSRWRKPINGLGRVTADLAVPIRAAESVQLSNGTETAHRHRSRLAIGAALSDDPVIAQINELLDERIRPYLASDGGWLEIVSLENKILKIRYQGACGSCPSSLTGTLMAIENMIKDEIDPEIEVIAE